MVIGGVLERKMCRAVNIDTYLTRRVTRRFASRFPRGQKISAIIPYHGRSRYYHHASKSGDVGDAASIKCERSGSSGFKIQTPGTQRYESLQA